MMNFFNRLHSPKVQAVETEGNNTPPAESGWEKLAAMADKFQAQTTNADIHNASNPTASQTATLNQLKAEIQQCYKNNSPGERLNTEIPTIDDSPSETPIKTTKETPPDNQIFLTHCTDFFPANHQILSNYDGNKRLPIEYTVDENIDATKESIFVEKSSISPRETMHFTINGKVRNTGDGTGKWDQPKFIIIEPYTGHETEFISGPMHPGDNYTDHSVKLSHHATIMVRDDAYVDLTDEQKAGYNIIKYSGDVISQYQTIKTNQPINQE